MILDKYFAAFDLGSSVITGAIGERKADNTIVIHAVEREDSEQSIRRGVIHNLDDVVHKVRRIIRKLNNQVQPEISKVYLGIGGQSLRTTNSSLSQFISGIIDEEKLIQLRKESMNRQIDGIGVVDVYDFAYRIDGELVRNPIGLSGQQLEVDHKVVTCREQNILSIKKCFEVKLDLECLKLIPSQQAAATAVLTDEEITRGCVLLDFGGGTTTVSIFKNKALSHTAVIPFGGDLITKDIMSLHFNQTDAENLKITQGSAFLDESLDSSALKQIIAKAANGSSIEMQRLHHVIEARLEEIVLNINNQIDSSGFTRGDLQSGVVIIGAAAMLRNLPQYLAAKLKMDVRRGALPKMVITSPEIGDLSRINVVAGLLMLAQDNCALVNPEIVVTTPEVIEQPIQSLFSEIEEKPEIQIEETTNRPIEEPKKVESTFNLQEEKITHNETESVGTSQPEKGTKPKKSGKGEFMKDLSDAVIKIFTIN
ncbi:MAG: cell division protein FtsA [Bacteroidales bacterium]